QVRSAHHSRPANATASGYRGISPSAAVSDGLREEPPHGEGPAAAVRVEHGDGVAVSRPVRRGGPGEEAGVLAAAEHGLLGAVDVREAEHLAADGVADEAREVW
uniref:Uncharacterized protein n=1 Tax=Oryza brachyantha TaxID=4533 RepID=J3M597_ORYBR